MTSTPRHSAEEYFCTFFCTFTSTPALCTCVLLHSFLHLICTFTSIYIATLCTSVFLHIFLHCTCQSLPLFHVNHNFLTHSVAKVEMRGDSHQLVLYFCNLISAELSSWADISNIATIWAELIFQLSDISWYFYNLVSADSKFLMIMQPFIGCFDDIILCEKYYFVFGFENYFTSAMDYEMREEGGALAWRQTHCWRDPCLNCRCWKWNWIKFHWLLKLQLKILWQKQTIVIDRNVRLHKSQILWQCPKRAWTIILVVVNFDVGDTIDHNWFNCRYLRGRAG